MLYTFLEDEDIQIIVLTIYLFSTFDSLTIIQICVILKC